MDQWFGLVELAPATALACVRVGAIGPATFPLVNVVGVTGRVPPSVAESEPTPPTGGIATNHEVGGESSAVHVCLSGKSHSAKVNLDWQHPVATRVRNPVTVLHRAYEHLGITPMQGEDHFGGL